MRRRTILVLAVCLMGVGLLIGSSQAKPVAPGIKVGVLLSNSGPLFFAGAFQKAAVELAASDNLGKVSYIFQDPGDSEAQARSALTNLKDQGVNLILAPIDSESAKRVLKVNQEQPVPMIAPSSLSESVGGNYGGKNYLFRMASTVTQDAAFLAQHLADDDVDSVGVITGSDNYSKSVTRLLAFDLTMLGARVGIVPMVDAAAFRKTNNQAAVLVGLEQTLDFLESNSNFLPKRVYFVSGNLANYSMYSWAKNLAGAKAIIPAEGVSQAFKVRLATAMNRPNILTTPNSPMFSLAKRSYDAIALAIEAWKDPANLRQRLSQNKNFNPEGYFKVQKYSVYVYGDNGMFSQFGQDIP